MPKTNKPSPCTLNLTDFARMAQALQYAFRPSELDALNDQICDMSGHELSFIMFLTDQLVSGAELPSMERLQALWRDHSAVMHSID